MSIHPKEVTLKSFLLEKTKLSEEVIDRELNILKEKHREIEVKKGDFLLKEGDICSHSFFVESGLLRYYSIDDKGKEHILHFAPEGWFISDRDSMFFNKPTEYYTEALEDSKVILLDKNFFMSFSEDILPIAELNERLLHNHIRHLQKRITQLLSATAEERYLDFVRIYPDIMLRVPQWMVASYLGVAPESLSRVRKDLANKWKEK
jgi:CRP-like cAMP-binding protein